MTSANKSSATSNPSQDVQRRSLNPPSSWDELDRFFEDAFPAV